MKRLLLTSFFSAFVVHMALATTNYVNNGVVSVISPPQILPTIDASNFVNNGTFYITNLNNDTQFQPPLPFESWNTRNWTNSNRMAGDSGFRFDYFDSVGQTNGWSANFQNSGNVNVTNSLIYGATYLIIGATNVFDRGTLAIGGAGLMTIDGKGIDLTRGTMGSVGNESNNLAGVQDLYWGTAVNNFGAFFAPSNVSSGVMPVTTIQGLQYVQIPQNLHFTDFFNTYISTNSLPGITEYDVLFLRQTNSAISTEVRFSAFGNPGVTKIVQWTALQTNRVNGVVTTNQLYLEDDFGDWFVQPQLVQTAFPVPIYQFLAGATFHLANYSITHAAPGGYFGDTVIAPTIADPTIFQGTNIVVFQTNVGYAATITAAAFPPNPTIQGATWTNTLDRIQITASGPGSSLNLARSIMDGETYLLLSATNHFVGSTNAAIISPISDIYLGSTNGLMAISNLTTPYVPRMSGEIQAWSTRWTNAAADGSLEVYNVTMVDSALAEKTPSQIQNLSLRSTNLMIGDVLNVFGSLLLDTVRLTVSTNAANAPTPYGAIDLTSGDLLWSASLPTLQYLTNFGQITSSNSIFFGGARTPPFYSGTFTEPYKAFVNHGLLASQGNSTWATYYEFSDTNLSGIGPISVQATTAILTNGTFSAPDADITITANNLLISNQVMQAGRSITLTVTNYLDDGSISNSVASIAGTNVWTVNGGINLLLLPTNGSLMGTTITNTAFSNAEVDDFWAGVDYGPYTTGFLSNSAIGHLILNGADSGSLFTFQRVNATNALYVDLLELAGATTNADGAGDFVGVYIQTNFTIYYGDAVVGGHSIAEKLNGKYGVGGNSGGRFLWVSNFNTGFFSSTNVTYTDGSVHRLNRGVVYSCDINSNGQPYPPTGGANATCDGTILKPNPVPVLTPATLKLTARLTNSPVKAIVLTWNTIPMSSNYLFVATSPAAARTNWTLVTNFISDSSINGQAMVIDVIKTNTPRYYRVNALSP